MVTDPSDWPMSFFLQNASQILIVQEKKEAVEFFKKKESLPCFNHRLPCHSRAFNSFSRETLVIDQHDCCVGLVLTSLDEKKQL